MYSLNEVFQQAVEDRACGNIDSIGYRARILFSVKIVEDDDSDEVVILNTTMRGSYYKEVTIAEYEVFKSKGWRYGVYVVSLSNYRRKLDRVELKIRDELNGRKNAKSIQLAKNSRKRIVENYRKVSNKLNLIKDE